MKLLRAEPGEGIVWIRRSIQVFFRQPFGLAGLFSLCALVAFSVMAIPVIGVLLLVLAPAVTLVFMIATRRAEAGERPLPGALSTLLAAGRPRLLQLLKLGIAYLATSVIAGWLAMAIDGGATAAWMDAASSAATSLQSASSAPSSAATAPAVRPPVPSGRMLFSWLSRLLLLLLVAVPFWHAPALVYWGRQSWAKSLFFSTLAIWRNRGAFAVYGLGWLGLQLVLGMALGMVAAMFGLAQQPPLAIEMVFFTIIYLYLTLMATSLWFTVAGCFGIDAEPSSPLHKETLA